MASEATQLTRYRDRDGYEVMKIEQYRIGITPRNKDSYVGGLLFEEISLNTLIPSWILTSWLLISWTRYPLCHSIIIIWVTRYLMYLSGCNKLDS